MLFRYGKFTVNNLIHLVLDSTHDLQPTLWYICEFNSWRNSENWPITRLKSSSPSFSERDDATAKKDLSLLQEQLIQREKTIAYKEKTLAQKENLLQQNLLQAELREREALEFEQEAKIKLEEVDEKEQELEAEKEKLKKNKNKGRFSTSSIPTHDGDDDENPTNENNDDNNQWLLRFSNLQKRLEIAYREIEGLRRPVSPAAGTTTTTNTNITATATAATAANDNDNNNDDNNDNNDDEDNENENSSSIITSLQHELKLTKENAQKQKEENILLRKRMNQSKNSAFSERNVSSEQNVSSLRRRGIRDNLDVDNLDVDEEEASSVGNRWAPLNFRVERMRMRGEEGMRSAMGSATTGRREGEEEEEEIVGMVEMQKEFKFLGRLR